MVSVEREREHAQLSCRARWLAIVRFNSGAYNSGVALKGVVFFEVFTPFGTRHSGCESVRAPMMRIF